MKKQKIAIIGAGLSGLSLAKRLVDNHFDVKIFEKSRGCGGRMSSKRTDVGYFDHGAQYFSAQSEMFQKFIKPYVDDGTLIHWKPKFGHMDKAGAFTTKEMNYPIYIPKGRMTHWAKAMAEEFEIEYGVEIAHCSKNARGSCLFDQNRNNLGDYDLVVSTAPAPQTEKILNIELPNVVQMVGCYALMLRCNNSISIPFDIIRFEDDMLDIMSLQSARRDGDIKDQAMNILVQTTNMWAEQHLEEDQSDIAKRMTAHFAEKLSIPIDKLEIIRLHRWLYASTPTPLAGLDYIFEPNAAMAACGDWCVGSKVEAAFLSAAALGEEIIRHFK